MVNGFALTTHFYIYLSSEYDIIKVQSIIIISSSIYYPNEMELLNTFLTLVTQTNGRDKVNNNLFSS